MSRWTLASEVSVSGRQCTGIGGGAWTGAHSLERCIAFGCAGPLHCMRWEKVGTCLSGAPAGAGPAPDRLPQRSPGPSSVPPAPKQARL